MVEIQVSTRLLARSDTAARWSSVNPTLSVQEIAFESDTGRFKVGDGATAWTWLAYATGEQGETGPVGSAGPAGATGATGAVGPAGADSTVPGPTGPTGPTGPAGATGATGAAGADGADGPSAYEVAVSNGFVGDETAWLASLVGATGATGATGVAGATGTPGATGLAGADGAPGATGATGPAGATGAAGADGADGADGLGWTGGSYDAGTGVVTFTSDDGLGFTTGDLRGAEGPPGLVAEGAEAARWLDFSGRFSALADKRWVCHGANYGVATENASQTGGTGADPSVQWNSFGAAVLSGETAIRVSGLLRSSAADITGVEVYVIHQTGPAFSWDSAGETVVTDIDRFTLSFEGVDWIAVDRAIDVPVPDGGSLIVWMKPIGTATATRYIHSNLGVVLQGGIGGATGPQGAPGPENLVFLATAPATDKLWFHSVDQILYYYDSVRAKWLSSNEYDVDFSVPISATTANLVLRQAGYTETQTYSEERGRPVRYDATVTAWTWRISAAV